MPDNPRATRYPEKMNLPKVDIFDTLENVSGMKFQEFARLFSQTDVNHNYGSSVVGSFVVVCAVPAVVVSPVLSLPSAPVASGVCELVDVVDVITADEPVVESSSHITDSNSSDSDSTSTDSSLAESVCRDMNPDYAEPNEEYSCDLDDHNLEMFECLVANKAAARPKSCKAVSSFANTYMIYRHSTRKTVHYGHLSDSDKLACNRHLSAMFRQSFEDPEVLWPKCKDCFGS